MACHPKLIEVQPVACGCDAHRAHRPGVTDRRRSELAHLSLTGPTRAHSFLTPCHHPPNATTPWTPNPRAAMAPRWIRRTASGGGPPSRAEARRRPRNHHHQTPAAAPSGAPCGACKFLRRKCVSGCVFAPHFGTEQGAARFAAVHKVFGASNVSKMLLHVPVERRRDAVVTICYEAQARLSDPVYGCVSTILALQHQVASLQTELSIVQSQLMSSRWAVTNTIQGLQQPQHTAVSLQPTYSNNSSASNNLVGLSSFSSGLELPNPRPPSRGLESLQLSQPSQDEEEESRNPAGFNNGIFDPK